MTEPACYLGLLIPAYNESARLPRTVETVVGYLRAQPYSWQLLIVDDGSTDDTLAVARALQVRTPELAVKANDHRGKAYAVRSGMLHLKAQFLVFTDADLSVPIEELARLLEKLEMGADVVIGSREAPGSRRIGEPAYRHLMGRVFSLTYRVLILPGVEDAQCGFKGFRQTAGRILFRHLLLYGEDAPVVRGGLLTGFDAELLFLARRWGFRVAEVPVDWYYGAGSKMRPQRDIPKMLGDILKIRWNAITGRYVPTRPDA